MLRFAEDWLRAADKRQNVFTYFMDCMTWDQAYTNGYREPHYPVPAIVYNYEWFQHWPSGEIELFLTYLGTYPCD